ncbi:MAG TPA: HTTM domain-containing protein, partial [Natronoarchaeum rubrum]|nr:HTTM domain-containing protein [Natronoarchaeum rubrum]
MALHSNGGASPAARLRAALERRLGVDARALAAFRALVAITLLVDLLHRSTDLVAFHTDRGVLPRAALAEQYPLAESISLHAVSGAAWVQACLFVLAGLLAIALLLGVRSRLAAAGSFALLVSLQARNPLVLNSGDVLLSVLLALALFVPLGERWSVDALGRADRDRRVASVATAALLLQIVAVYATNAVFKLHGGWLGGDALWTVFRLDQFTILLGNYLSGTPKLAGAVAIAWLALLGASPLLVVLTGRARTALVLLFLGAHLGMLLTVSVGLFPLVLTAGVVLFLPASAWDAVERRVRPHLGSFALDWWAAVLTVARSRAPAPPRSSSIARWRRRAGLALGVLALVSVLAWGVGSVGAADPLAPIDGAETEDYTWSMFADPPDSYRWYGVTARLDTGREVDALGRSVEDWTTPPDAARTYGSFRWRKFMSG